MLVALFDNRERLGNRLGRVIIHYEGCLDSTLSPVLFVVVHLHDDSFAAIGELYRVPFRDASTVKIADADLTAGSVDQPIFVPRHRHNLPRASGELDRSCKVPGWGSNPHDLTVTGF